MRIILINPKVAGLRDIGGLRAEAEPMGLCFIAACLERAGHEARVVHVVDGSDHTLERAFATFEPDLVGISSYTHNFSESLRVAGLAKAHCGDVPVMLGGPHVSALPEQALVDERADFGVVGEGEETVLELVRSLERGEGQDGIAGLVHRAAGDVIYNGPRARIQDLGALPIPSRCDLPMDRYRQAAPVWIPPSQQRCASVNTARGCRFGCTFCATPTTWGKVIGRPTDHVLLELEHLVEDYGINYVWFSDEDFFYDPSRVFEILEGAHERGLGLIFRSFISVRDVIHCGMRMMKDLHDLGLRGVLMGIESTSDDVLRRVRKPHRGKDLAQALHFLDEAGIHVRGSYMIGYPWETEDELIPNLECLLGLPAVEDLYITYVTPFPGTVFWEECKKENLLLAEDYDLWDTGGTVLRTPIPASRLAEIRHDYLARFYSDQRVVQRMTERIRRFPCLAASYREVFPKQFAQQTRETLVHVH